MSDDWTPEHDEPIEWQLSVAWPDIDHRGHAHIHRIDRRWIEGGLREAAEKHAAIGRSIELTWRVLGGYVNDPAVREHIDARLPGLTDDGRWRCPWNTWHGIGENCHCNTEGGSA